MTLTPVELRTIARRIKMEWAKGDPFLPGWPPICELETSGKTFVMLGPAMMGSQEFLDLLAMAVIRSEWWEKQGFMIYQHAGMTIISKKLAISPEVCPEAYLFEEMVSRDDPTDAILAAVEGG